MGIIKDLDLLNFNNNNNLLENQNYKLNIFSRTEGKLIYIN
jgi:hypothetical protein